MGVIAEFEGYKVNIASTFQFQLLWNCTKRIIQLKLYIVSSCFSKSECKNQIVCGFNVDSDLNITGTWNSKSTWEEEITQTFPTNKQILHLLNYCICQ